MGFFSWITQDTKQSILNKHTGLEFPVMMTDNKGNRWIEDNYNGYGMFGGKDYYVLIAEMNDSPEVNPDDSLEINKIREKGIDLYFSERKDILYPNLTEDMQWTWRNERPDDCPNQGFFLEDEESDDTDYEHDSVEDWYDEDEAAEYDNYHDDDLGGTGHGDDSFSDADPGL
jgi:hypothetical protein